MAVALAELVAAPALVEVLAAVEPFQLATAFDLHQLGGSGTMARVYSGAPPYGRPTRPSLGLRMWT